MQKKKQIKKIKKKHVVEFENNSFLTELYGNHDQNLAKFADISVKNVKKFDEFLLKI